MPNREQVLLESILTELQDGTGTGVSGSHVAAITVAQTTAAAIMATTAAPRGVKVWSPDGTGGSTSNTAVIAVGYSGLTLANAVDFLQPGDSAVIPCADASEVFAVSTAASQTLRVEVL